MIRFAATAVLVATSLSLAAFADDGQDKCKYFLDLEPGDFQFCQDNEPQGNKSCHDGRNRCLYESFDPATACEKWYEVTEDVIYWAKKGTGTNLDEKGLPEDVDCYRVWQCELKELPDKKCERFLVLFRVCQTFLGEVCPRCQQVDQPEWTTEQSDTLIDCD